MLHFYWRLTPNFLSDGELPEWRVGACLTHFCLPYSAQRLGPSSREAGIHREGEIWRRSASGVVWAPRVQLSPPQTALYPSGFGGQLEMEWRTKSASPWFWRKIFFLKQWKGNFFRIQQGTFSHYKELENLFIIQSRKKKIESCQTWICCMYLLRIFFCNLLSIPFFFLSLKFLLLLFLFCL